jgi:hypothetical protein
MKTKILKYWIKERHNLQTGTYYVACGQMTKSAAKSIETGCLYGSNKMHSYDSIEEYKKRLSELNL